MTVLVVDDDSRILSLTGQMLRLAGYTVLETNAPTDALRIFERNTAQIDLVLSDVEMPGLTGPELAGRLRHRNPQLPFVFMSGTEAPGVLHKPFRMADLWATVSDALKDAPAAV
jgi:two-component system, cell cycle sensor histidine kinase and response regulator CckA